MARATRKFFFLTVGALLTSIAFAACLESVTPPTATNVTGTTHTITAKVVFPDLSSEQQAAAQQQRPAQTGVPWTISFTVISGPNAGKTSDTLHDCQPSCSGEFENDTEEFTVTWTYTGTGGPGLDTIQVCVSHEPEDGEPADDCQNVTKTWVDPTATSTSTSTATPTMTRTPTLTPTGTLPPTATATPFPTSTATLVPATPLPTVVQRQLGGGIAGVVAAAAASERQRQVTATSVAIAAAPSVIITAPNTGDAGISQSHHSDLPMVGAGVLALAVVTAGLVFRRRTARS